VSKNVAVFVDVANIFYAAKAAGVDIDYVTLLKSATAGRDFVRAYAYTGLDPDNENQRQFHAFLARNSYKVVSKDIRKYGDGKVKANLDIELVVDMMKTARNLDIAVIVSGDGDFAPAIRAVQEMGVRVEVISFRGNTSSDLVEAADQFIEITQVAKVDKASTRSGRRVASDEADLSMTEVPDKETEGTGRTRRRRTTKAAEAPAAEAAAPAARTTRRRTTATAAPVAAAAGVAPVAAAAGGALVALPGEKLSKAAAVAAEATVAPLAEEVGLESAAEEIEGVAGETAGEGTGGRRRRRRGGRGRGRRRGAQAEEGQPIEGEEEPELEPEREPEVVAAPPGRRPTPFGSVWDTQIGTPSAPATLGPIDELSEEELQEPEIPEYILAERRQRGQRDQRGRAAGRGSRGAYQAAMERERYGRGGMTGTNRYPDTSGRTDRAPTHGADRSQRGPAPRDEGRGRSAEPWSEVPPELEAMLRAQAAGRVDKPREERPAGAPKTAAEAERAAAPTAGAKGGGRGTRSRTRAAVPAESVPAAAEGEQVAAAPAAPATRRSRKPPATAGDAGTATASSPADEAAKPAPKRPSRGRSTSAAAATAGVGNMPDAAEDAKASKASTSRRARTPKASTAPPADAPVTGPAETGEAPQPRRRTSTSSREA